MIVLHLFSVSSFSGTSFLGHCKATVKDQFLILPADLHSGIHSIVVISYQSECYTRSEHLLIILLVQFGGINS